MIEEEYTRINFQTFGYLRGDGFKIPIDGAIVNVTHETVPIYSGVPQILKARLPVRDIWEIDIRGHDVLNSLIGITPRVIWQCLFCGNLTVDVEAPCCGCGGRKYSEYRRHS